MPATDGSPDGLEPSPTDRSGAAGMPRRMALGAAAFGAVTALAAGCGPVGTAAQRLAARSDPSRTGTAGGAATPPASFNVRSFGAAGNGSTDDTGPIQAAIGAATQAGGGRVLLPAGRYAITGIHLAAGVDLQGEGRDNSVLRYTSPAGNVVTVASVGFNRLADFQITFAQRQTSGAAIYLDKAFTIDIDSVFIEGSNQLAYDGIVLHESTATFIRDFNVYGCQGDAVLVEGPTGNDAYLQGGIINLGQTTSGAGVHILNFGAGAVNITDVDILTGEYSLLVQNSNYLRFENTYFDSSSKGAVLESGHLITFANCWFSNRPGPGLHVGAVRGCSVVGGQAANCAGHGIHITDSAQYVSLAAVQVIGNNTGGQGADGILVDSGASYVTIQGCLVGNNPGVFGGPGQQVGIHVSSTAGTPYALIGNMLFGNVTAPVLDHGQGGYVAGNLS